jgi:hypothetical protein
MGPASIHPFRKLTMISITRFTALATMALACLQPVSVQAQSAKVAADLQSVLSASATPAVNWARDINGRALSRC